MTHITREERQAMRESLHRLLAAGSTEADVRRTMASVAGYDPVLGRQRAELGVTGLWVDFRPRWPGRRALGAPSFDGRDWRLRCSAHRSFRSARWEFIDADRSSNVSCRSFMGSLDNSLAGDITNIQRSIIAEQELGLPGDLWTSAHEGSLDARAVRHSRRLSAARI